MPTEAEIQARMKLRGLNPAEWQYDAAQHGFVPRAVATQPEAKQPGMISRAAEAISKPFEFLGPQVPRRDIAGIPWYEAPGAVTYNVGADMLNGLRSPLGLATLPLTSVKIIKGFPNYAKTVGGLLSALMAKQTFQGISELGGGITHGDLAETLAGAANTAMGGLGVAGGAGIVAKSFRPSASAKVATDSAAKSLDKPLAERNYNSVEPGEALSVDEQTLANRNARIGNLPTSESIRAEQDARTLLPEPDPRVASRQVARQDAFAAKAEAAGTTRVEGEAKKLVSEELDSAKLYDEAYKRISEDLANQGLPVESSAVDSQVRALGYKPAEPLEPLTQPDMLLGDPVARVKKPIAFEDPTISGVDLPTELTRQPGPAILKQLVEAGVEPRPSASLRGAQSLPIKDLKLAEESQASLEPTLAESGGSAKNAVQAALDRIQDIRETQRMPSETITEPLFNEVLFEPTPEILPRLPISKRPVTQGIKPKINPNAGESGAINLSGVSTALRALRDKANQWEPVLAMRAGNLPFIESQIDTVRRLPNPGADTLAGAFTELRATRANMGGWDGRIREILTKLPPGVADRIHRAGRIDANNKNFNERNALAPDEQSKLEEIRSIFIEMAKNQQAARHPVREVSGNLRQREIDPYFWPVSSSKNVRMLVEQGKAPQLAQDFIDNQVRKYGLTSDEAAKNLKDYISHYNVYGSVDGKSATFGGVRRVEGMDLPDSWADPNAVRALSQYARNFARDRAHYDKIEANPDVMHMLGMKTDYYGRPVNPTTPHLTDFSSDPRVTRVLDSYLGEPENASGNLDPIIKGMGQIINSLIMQIPAKINDNASVASKLSAELPNAIMQTPGMLAHIAANAALPETYANAIAHGLIKPERGFANRIANAPALAKQLVSNLVSHHETFAEVLSDTAKAINSVSGAQQLEVIARLQAQAAGEFIAKARNDLARAGDQPSISWMENLLGPKWKNASVEEIGSRVAELSQGRYDERSMPYISPGLRPIFALSRWSIEMANKDFGTLKKAFQRDPAPLVGLVGTGLLMSSGREWLMNKLTGIRSNLPSNAEIDTATDNETKAKLNAYRTLALMDTVGIGGIVTHIGKGIVDASFMDLNARGFNFPLFEVSKNIGQHGAAAISAINDGESPSVVLPELTKNLLMNNIQNLKFLQNVLAEHAGVETPGASSDDRNRRKDYRDKRMFEITQNKPMVASRAPEADYSNIEGRRFKRSGDVNEAETLVPSLVDRAERHAGGNPELLAREFTNLRSMPIHSMPDPDTNPIRFEEYFNWLVATQGEKAARAVVDRYIKQKNVNAAKKKLVPTMGSGD